MLQQRIEEILAFNEDLSSQQNTTSNIIQTTSSQAEDSATQIQATESGAANTSASLADSRDNSFRRIPLPSLETFDGTNF